MALAVTIERQIAVRRPTPTDEAVWRSLWGQYQQFYEVSISETVTGAVWRRLFDASEPVACFLAIEGDWPLGFVHVIVHRSFWTEGDYCYLQDLFVEPNFRKQGVARALIDQAACYAAEQGCSRLHWLTHESNRTAQRLYNRIAERSGFIQYVQELGTAV
jgi:GNAT superfamily N-acetyltransferase